MSRFTEAFRCARQRINPEGLAVGAALSYISPAVMIPMQAGLTYVIHEIAQDADPDIFKICAIGLLGIANAISVGAETRTLRSNEYSASPVASTVNILTGKPLVSSIGSHLVNYAQLSILNPINAAAIWNQDTQLLAESASATSLTLTAWFTGLNILLSRGKTKEVIRGIQTARGVIFDAAGSIRRKKE